MTMTSFLSSRKSVRHFKNRDISPNTIEKLNEVFRMINTDSQKAITFHAYPEGETIYKGLDGHAGYNGVMIKAPAYITLELDSSSPKDRVMGMYRAEEIISMLEDEGLASCWISLFDTPKEVKEQVFGFGLYPNLCIAIGYPKARNPFVAEATTGRLPVDELVYKDEFGAQIQLETLERLNLDDLFYYVRFAPNTLNSQTWRFVVKDQSIELYLVPYKDTFYYEDAGIMMYYFEQMFQMSGYTGKWAVEEDFVENEKRVKIAEIKL
ncbi:MAG: nitroreductase family protein [Tissierellia bacterium]|nr:nitroreductase family protein [Tissierellia bacterium]